MPGFRDLVLACKMHDHRMSKNIEQHSIPSHSSDVSDYNG